MKASGFTVWKKLTAYQIDSIDAAFPFSRRLAREQGWSTHPAAGMRTPPIVTVMVAAVTAGAAAIKSHYDLTNDIHILIALFEA